MFFRGILFLGITFMSDLVAARFCEGGHICSLPRECCTQGCCPPYQSGIPRQLPPPSEHVLNLFFISHWFFWCVVVAIILAILCAYSLWKKRRSLCGWGFPENRAQSEGDSAGSCYAPPQYSRCSSFHHPPPPYTEVTSKPDLYPLVFTCNSDNGKTGSSYLMVQYFRNYIVRPAGSLSAASTVDSLSSSFICNVNEANTLVPPPYSRAASPEMGYSTSFQHHYVLPRSASQLVCPNNRQQSNSSPQTMYNQNRASHYNAVVLTGAVGGDENAVIVTPYHTHLNRGESGNFDHAESSDSKQSVISIDDGNDLMHNRRLNGFTQSQSDQHFRYNVNSNSSISDIFVNSNCTTTIAGEGGGGGVGVSAGGSIVNSGRESQVENHRRSRESPTLQRITDAPEIHRRIRNEQEPQSLPLDSNVSSVTTKSFISNAGGTPAIFSNGSIKPNPLHRTSTNPTQFSTEHNRDAVYNSCNSIGGISVTMPMTANTNGAELELNDLRAFRQNLETCCKLLQHQQQMPTVGSPLRNSEFIKKYAEEGLRSYMTSGTCSGVSSLANIGTPSSPPQATSPTGEVKEILDQIRQLQDDVNNDDFLLNARPTLHHTMSSPSAGREIQLKRHSADTSVQLQRYATMPEQQNPANASPTARSPTSSNSLYIATQRSPDYANKITTALPTNKRPSSLQQNKKKFCSPKPNRAMYIPMAATTSSSSNRCILKSPVGSMVSANFFTTRGRVRKGWISRSAPTTPGTCLPPNCLSDDSPLLNEHDEDQEGEQNAEMD